MPAIYQRLRYETELALMAWHFSHVPASFSQEQNVLNKIYICIASTARRVHTVSITLGCAEDLCYPP